MLQGNLAISEKYNGLYEVFEADVELNRKEKIKSIDKLLSIIVKHKLESYVGIRLLHKHSNIADSEVMVENYRFDDVGFALITAPVCVSQMNDDCVPNSWIFSGNEFIPMEFSFKRLVKNSEVNPYNNRKFFEELALEIRKNNLSDIIGPSLLGSDFIEHNRPSHSSLMSEFTDQDERANILRFVVPSASFHGSSVETHWCVSDEMGNPGESSPDDIRKVTVKCTKICPEIGNPPRHQGTFVHNQS